MQRLGAGWVSEATFHFIPDAKSHISFHASIQTPRSASLF
ncbi:hypothetical protein HMPREF9069_00209 [Atopobium sp. oral taxon 810 str. F0209]|nr:hypothetical protein HMPREF9069_00209 [Atopobium sp. oral taxon 810 str. F0209]